MQPGKGGHPKTRGLAQLQSAHSIYNCQTLLLPLVPLSYYQMGMLNWFLLSSFAGISLWLIKSRRGRRLYPPGPKPDPFVGNIRQMPTKNQWITYAEWANEYGPLTYLNVLGQSIVILNTQKAAIDLLEKRGLIYADRPHSVMCNDLVGEFNDLRRACELRFWL